MSQSVIEKRNFGFSWSNPKFDIKLNVDLNDRKTGLIISDDNSKFPLETSLLSWSIFYDKFANRAIAKWKHKKVENGYVLKWFKQKFFPIYGKLIHREWDRVVQADPKLYLIHKNLFRTLGPNKYAAYGLRYHIDKIYDYPYDDYIKYKAAIATQYPEIAILKIDKWREFYGKPLKYLNQTLDNIPHMVGINHIIKLRDYNLTKPLISKVEFIFYTSTTERDINCNIIQNASREEIREVFKLSEFYTRYYNTQNLIHFVNYLKDYREPYNGNLLGLFRRSEAYHRELYRGGINRNVSQKYPNETLLKSPPVELLNDPNIKFIKTVGELIEEGKNMKHCVGSYTEMGVRGDGFFFHTLYKNSKSTTHVDRKGVVVQSKGPTNITNEASKYAEKMLSIWAKKFPKEAIINRVKD